MDGTYHVNHIKKGSVYTPQGIVDTFDGYKTTLKNTLLNKFTIKTPDNKIQEVTLQDGLKELNYNPGLLWIMPQFMSNRTISFKFTKIQKIQYKQEDEIMNKDHSCTALKCS